MDKGAYRKKAEAKIEEQQAKLDQLRAKAKGAGADAQIEADQQIGELEKALKTARRKLEDIGAAAEDAWEDVAKSFDRAWEDVSGSAKKLFSRFS
jgi:F0F1-type ATP synthase membrane subunit b/b'